MNKTKPIETEYPYPRICAHRGFNTAAPENSLPAFAAAVVLGADEIEFDVWVTKDGQLVSLHDDRLERVSNGIGLIYDHTLAELEQLDFGSAFSPVFAGLRIPRFEEILKTFAGRTIFNIHIKPVGDGSEFSERDLEKIVQEIYDCGVENSLYFMSTDPVLAKLREIDERLPRCCGSWLYPGEIVTRALKLGCTKVQLTKPKFDRALVEQAHAEGLRCNVFWADTPEEALRFRAMGIDTILTNDYWRIRQAEEKQQEKNSFEYRTS